jgi:hypothetical protein
MFALSNPAQDPGSAADLLAMTIDESGLDRLMPRHALPAALTIGWNTKPRRSLLARISDTSTDGVIRDLSLNGALIEVDQPSGTKVRDIVEIALGTLTGTVQVRRIVEPNDEHNTFYGVSFVETQALKDQFEILIGHLRGDDDRLRDAWQNAD